MLVGRCGSGDGGTAGMDDSGGLERLIGKELVIGCGGRGGDTS